MLALRHPVAGAGGDADLRLELADIRGGRRAQRGRDPRGGYRRRGHGALKPRRRLLASAVATAAAAAAGSYYWYLEAHTIGSRCGRLPPAATTGYRHEWQWWPFAYICVYDEGGREIGRRFPERPHIFDLR